MELIIAIIFYIIEIILLKLYKLFLSLFLFVKAGILKIPGSKLNPKGYNKRQSKAYYYILN